jgi:hypothetical protein
MLKRKLKNRRLGVKDELYSIKSCHEKIW